MIEVDFDPEVVTYHDLLKLFWNHHEYGLTTKVKKQVTFTSILIFIFTKTDLSSVQITNTIS